MVISKFKDYVILSKYHRVYVLPVGFTVEYRNNCYGWIQQRSYGRRTLFSFATIEQAVNSAWDYNND